MKHTIKTYVAEIKEIEIEFPSFYFSGETWYGLIDVDNIYFITNKIDSNCILNQTAEVCERTLAVLSKLTPITEDEFMAAYNEAVMATTLKPRLEYYAGENGIETKSTII